MPLPPEDLQAALAPVDLVWARLERPAARRLVEAVARRELARVVGFVGPVDAPQVLAERIGRLETQMQLGRAITDPVGWLIGLALPRPQRCGDVQCDDRVLLGSGRGYPPARRSKATAATSAVRSRPPSTQRCPAPRR